MMSDDTISRQDSAGRVFIRLHQHVMVSCGQDIVCLIGTHILIRTLEVARQQRNARVCCQASEALVCAVSHHGCARMCDTR